MAKTKNEKTRKPLATLTKARLAQIDQEFGKVTSSDKLYSRDKSLQNKVVKLGGIQGVRELMNDPKMGLSDTKLLEKLKKGLNATRLVWSKSEQDWLEVYDWNTTLKALEIALKLKGYIGNDNKEEQNTDPKKITVNFNLVKARDQEEVKRLLQGTISDEDSRKPIITRLRTTEAKDASGLGINELDADALEKVEEE